MVRLIASRIVALLILVNVMGVASWAAQDATIRRDNSPIRAEPSDASKVLDYLQEGDEIRVSSYPVNGAFYKVRARNGQYGWLNIKFTTMTVPDPNAVDPNAPPEPEADRKYVLRFHGGGAFFKPQDLNDVYSFNELNNGWLAGGEFGWRFSDRFSLLFRAEGLLKDVVAKEITTNYVYNLSTRSYPMMLGIDFLFVKNFPVKISLGIYAGIGMRTSFSSEALSLPTPNRVMLESDPFTTLVRINITRPIGRLFSVFGDVGYRILKSELIDTSNSASGGSVFKIAGEFKQRTIDLSGFMLSAGFGIHF